MFHALPLDLVLWNLLTGDVATGGIELPRGTAGLSEDLDPFTCNNKKKMNILKNIAIWK